MNSSASVLQSGRPQILVTVIAAILIIATLIAAPATVSAQAYFGTVSGVLTDASGAVVEGAKVVLTDQQKGYAFNTTSDSSGRYLFRSIPPGLYLVSAEAKGFGKALSGKFKLDINDNSTTNLTLKVAGTSQSVQVTGEAQAIQTQDAETGQVVNRRFINDLPLIDRYVMDLTFLAPGVTEMDDQCPTNCTGTNFTSNGSRGSTADILSDGASITNFEPNGGITNATYVPSPEAVEEFKVEQSNFSAEYGFSGGSVVNMVTRSGTNKFHGGAYDFIRNQVTDANNWFNDHDGIPIAPLRRNNYGGTFGGPLIKNKTFFFFDWDGTRQTTMSTTQAGVPSAAMRTGDFGEVCGANGGTFATTGPNAGLCSVVQGQIYDPYSGVYNPNDGGTDRSTFIPYNNIAAYTSPGSTFLPASLQLPQVPGNLIDPVAQKMLNLYPTANIPGGSIYDNWIGSGPNYGYNDQFDIKIDHRFSQKNLMSVKYSQNWNHGTAFNCFKNFIDPCSNGPNKTTAHLFAINDTYTFTPTLLLNATLGFTRGAQRIDAYNPQGVANPLSALGFPSYLGTNGFVGAPAIFISGGNYLSAALTSAGTDPYGNYKQGQDTGQLTVTLDKVSGPHEMKFGFEGRLHQQNYIQTNAPVGIFNFDEHGSSACPNDFPTCGGDAMATFLMGNAVSDGNGGNYYEIQFQPATENYQYATFAQDNWKVNPKLTLNLGLRYDVSLPRTDRFNHQNWFDPNVTNPLNGGSISYVDQFNGPTTLQLKGGEVFATPSQRTNYVTDWKDFQPRIGFAYQFAPKMVVRGGYGIYYGQSRSGASGVVPYGGQGFSEYTNMITTYQNQGDTQYLHLSDPYPNGLNQPAGSSLGLLNDIGYGANGPLRIGIANRTPNEQSWSFGVERELPGNVVLTAQYVGKKGTHLPFSGANQLDILGPQIEGYSQTQIGNLNTYVNNPFSSQNGGPISDPNSVMSSSQVQESQLLVPFPQFTSVSTDVQMIANSIYHGLQIVAEKRYSNGLQFLVTYTWSKSIDDSSQADDNVTWLGSFTSLQDPNKPWLERSLSTFDIPNVLQFSYTYDLPFGRGRAMLGNMPRVLEAIVGGWKTNGVWRMNGGRPLAMTTSDGTPLPTYGSVRPNIIGTPKRNHSGDWINNYFVDPTVFQTPPPFTLGDAPRAIGEVRTPWAFNVNLSVGKEFPLREEMNLEFRVEAQNAFNHPVFGTPDTATDDPNFGVITYTSNTPREIQVALKFNF
jgi:carboxypeptidase family protein